MSETAEHFQFVDIDQQRDTARIGMWIFLATEVMFFGALFTAYAYFQYLHPEGFAAASRRCDFWLGTANTAVLLLSSLTMALAVQAAKSSRQGALTLRLFWTMILGAVFLALKGVEYSHHIHDHLWPVSGFSFDPSHARGAQLFFYLYFAMTGLHALHMLGGILTLLVIAVFSMRGKFSSDYYTPVELAGLYWHFVDVVWLFLFPMFYLLGGH